MVSKRDECIYKREHIYFKTIYSFKLKEKLLK